MQGSRPNIDWGPIFGLVCVLSLFFGLVAVSIVFWTNDEAESQSKQPRYPSSVEVGDYTVHSACDEHRNRVYITERYAASPALFVVASKQDSAC